MMTWGRFYWPYFIVLASSLFLIPEIIALATNWHNTLSQWSWAELNVTTARIPIHSIAWWFSLASWILALVILTLHIWFRKFG